MASQTRTVFLGCPPDPETVASLCRWQTRLQADLSTGPAQNAVRWVRRSSLHLTLHYLGSLATPQIQSLQAHTGEILTHGTAIPCPLGDPGVFPHASHPRGVWVAVQDAQGQLSQLHAALHRMLRDLGLESRSERLRPHFTIGRLPRSIPRSQRRLIVQSVQKAHAQYAGPSGPGVLDRVHLYESLPQPGGNAYPPLATWPLILTSA